MALSLNPAAKMICACTSSSLFSSLHSAKNRTRFMRRLVTETTHSRTSLDTRRPRVSSVGDGSLLTLFLFIVMAVALPVVSQILLERRGRAWVVSTTWLLAVVVC